MNAATTAMRRKQELLGVVWGFFALFLGLCLISYSPRDPCLFIRQGSTQPVANWMGPAGAAVSGWMTALLGFSVWLMPPVLAVLAVRAFRGKEVVSWKGGRARLVSRAIGAVTLALSIAVFMDLSLGAVGMDGETVRAGGIAGQALAGLVSGIAGRPGALFIDALVVMVALMAAVDFSPVKAAKILAGAALWVRDRAGDFVVRRREMKRRRLLVARDRELIEKTRTRREIKIVVEQKEKPPPKHQPRQVKMPFISEGEFTLPPADLLDEVSISNKKVDSEALLMNAKILENKLRDFGVQGEVVEVQPGPVITMYEYKPGPGVKINKISNLADDLAMALAAMSVRIIAPIPGKDVVGIEISNRDRETVYMREIVESEEFSRVKGAMPMALGKNITGDPFAFDLRKAPHLLVAGATGSGKSVCLNSMIMSVLYRSTPREVQMLMIDPKKLELSVYEGIPHLIHRVIADPKDAALSLKWAVAEMDRRYSLLAEQGVRNIDSYNRLAIKSQKERKKAAKKHGRKTGDGDTVALADRIDSQDPDKKDKTDPPEEPMPLILVVIDELADLMMVAARDIEESICRLAQMARAAGMHLVVATQRPSVDVITGLIKANFPARIGFKVASKTDSRTILDQNGAERMLGQGDMLFIQPGTSNMIRLHGALVSDQEIKKVTEFWKEQGEPDYDEEIIKPRADDKSVESEEADEKWDEALRVVATTGQASVSMLQRKLKIGYNRAARIIERMAEQGIVGPSDGVKPREVLIDPYQLEQ